ncbi:rCG63404 [Rattus norvegicus]|uniref:RCG63404 n=1 Tax=Rattus norvegicus TaxID=10116 RepID=A6IH49_RAT|nr:rCG63404 [Rattus norvegicus]
MCYLFTRAAAPGERLHPFPALLPSAFNLLFVLYAAVPFKKRIISKDSSFQKFSKCAVQDETGRKKRPDCKKMIPCDLVTQPDRADVIRLQLFSSLVWQWCDQRPVIPPCLSQPCRDTSLSSLNQFVSLIGPAHKSV